MTHAPDRARRHFLGRAGRIALWASCSGMPVRQVAAAPEIPRRIVVMDWALTETLLDLGVVPVGVSAPDWYRRTIVEPTLPSDVADVGLLYSPNYEALEELAPDLMIITPGHAPARPLLERLAPTLTLGRYMSNAKPYAALRAETLQMAMAVGRNLQGAKLLATTDTVLAQVRARLAQRTEWLRRPVVVAELIDAQYLRVYGAGSLLDTMLSKIGVINALNEEGKQPWSTGHGGFTVIPLRRLFDLSQATLLVSGGVRPSQREALKRNPVWQALPFVQSRDVAVLPVIAPYGGLVSMQRFVLATEKALADLATRGGGLG